MSLRSTGLVNLGIGFITLAVGCNQPQQQRVLTASDAGVPGMPTDSGASPGSDGSTQDAWVQPPGTDSGAPPPDEPWVWHPPRAHGCIDDVSPGQREVSCDGYAFNLSVPSECMTSACGLIVDVHGGSMNAGLEEKNTNLAAMGMARGYVVVQPNAPVHDGETLPGWIPEQDDAHVLEFLLAAHEAFSTDPKRIHMTGFSLGSLMTWRFACAHAELFASIAPAAGTGTPVFEDPSPGLDCAFEGSEVPSRQMSILFMHGTKDAFSHFHEALDKRDAIVEAFGMGAGTVVDSDAMFSRTRYENPAGTVFEFIQHDYVSDDGRPLEFLGITNALEGHCYPGSDDLQWKPIDALQEGAFVAFGCEPPNAFHWGEVVLGFFEAHPKP